MKFQYKEQSYLPTCVFSGTPIEKDSRKPTQNVFAFKLVMQEVYTDKNSGEKKEKPAFFAECVVFGDDIAIVEKCIAMKHKLVAKVTPKLESWETDGVKKYKTVYELRFCEAWTFENGKWHNVDLNDVEPVA